MFDSRKVPFLVFSLIIYVSLTWSLIPSDAERTVTTHYVGANCDDDLACHTLPYFLRNQSMYFKSDTTFIFLPGYHSPVVNTSLTVRNVSRLTLQGKNATISCKDNYFSFESVQELKISALHFQYCGRFTLENLGRAGLTFKNGRDLSLKNVIVSNSVYQALLFDNVLGTTSVLWSLVEKCCTETHFTNTSSSVVRYSTCSESSQSDSSLLFMENSAFQGNFNPTYKHHQSENQNAPLSVPLAGGLSIIIVCSNVRVVLDNITLINNTGRNGGNLALLIMVENLLATPIVIVRNSFVLNGTALEGGGLFLFILLASSKEKMMSLNESCQSVITINNTLFMGNTATFGGGAIAMRQKESNIHSTCGCIEIKHCEFVRNSLRKGGAGATAINTVNFVIAGIFSHIYPQIKTIIDNCSFKNNFVAPNSFNSSGSAVLFVKLNRYFELKSVTIDSNNSTAILGTETNFVFSGNITISNNNASSGGGLLLCQGAVMFLKPGVIVTIFNNYAEHTGGGIAIESICMISRPICFFQLASSSPKDFDDVRINLYNNTAKYAGDNLYGGAVEYCYILESPTQDFIPVHVPANKSISVYNEIFDIQPQGPGLPYVTSAPTHVCLCINNIPYCNISLYHVNQDPVYPGQKFTFEAVLVGQLNGSVPGIIEIWMDNDLPFRDNHLFLKTDQKNCSKFSYIVNSTKVNGYEIVNVIAAQQGDTSITDHLREYRKLELNVSIQNCPKGFQLSRIEPFNCVCNDILKYFNVSCNIEHRMIEVQQPMWIGFALPNNDTYSFILRESTLVQKFCPFEYCVRNNTVNIHTSNVNFTDSKILCAHQRTGIMCGACPSGYSLQLGAAHCDHCSNTSLYLLLVFALAGFLLVLVLTFLNMTVSDGTINALIFYGNILQVQKFLFFNFRHNTPGDFLRGFIAWLNLDLGITLCFFNGMDEYSKAWLQFVFPLYIWIILGFIVFLSRRFNIVTRLVGRNAVKIFATLILLSYPKLLRAIIASMSPSFLYAADDVTYTVWTVDGNVPFLKGKHIFLFVFALLLSLIIIPFIFCLLFIQVLERYTQYRIFYPIKKFKPLFDAYTGPYNDKARFWTGLLLVMRLLLFTVSASTLAKSSADVINSLTVLALVFLLFLASTINSGIYKKTSLNVLECTFLVNLILLSVGTMFARNNDYHQLLITTILVGIAFFIFVGIVAFHVLKVLYSINCVKIRVQMFKESISQKLLQRHHRRESSDTRNVHILAQNFPPFVQFTEDREPLLADNGD